MMKYFANLTQPACGTVNQVNRFFDGPSVYPEYLTDANILICPSDADGQELADEFWVQPGGGADPCRFWEVSYEYLGWAVIPSEVVTGGSSEDVLNTLPFDTGLFNMDLLMAFANEMTVEAPAHFAVDPSSVYEDDLSYNGGTVYRLREGIERFFISDINNAAASNKGQSEIAVMWDSVWSLSTSADGYSQFNHVPGGGNVLFMDGHVEFIKYPSSWPVCVAYVTMMEMMEAMLNP
jgi:prepilin-type processing-associated H-X9-DG protein